MDTLTPNNCSKSNSSGSSATSSSMDLKSTKKQRQREQKLSHSRSFLHLLSKHLGRHFLHHHHHHHHHQQHHQNESIYSSQDDMRSSSTNSFSLSFERGSHADCHLNAGSSLELCSGGDERTSRASSAFSRYSNGLDFYDGYPQNSPHIYVETLYRPTSALEQRQQHMQKKQQEQQQLQQQLQQQQTHYDDTCSIEYAEADENENLENFKANAENTRRSHSHSNTTRSASVNSKGLHLSRISISSSVSRMLQHFSASTASSMRSISCSNTPLRQLKATAKSKKSLTPKHSSTSTSTTHSTVCSSGTKEKKQQSILRPPAQYVYMKGMSGLYSRVPSYAAYSPYTMHHMY